MSIEYLRDVKPLQDDGLNDSEIAVALSCMTAFPIPCEATKVVLEGESAIEENPVTQQRSGSLIAHYESLSGSPAKLLAWFISHVMIRGVEITSNEYPRCLEVASVIGSLPPELSGIAEQIIDLGGGQPNIDTTAADVEKCRSDFFATEAMYEREAEASRKYNEFLSPVLTDPNATNETIAAALQQWSDSYTDPANV